MIDWTVNYMRWAKRHPRLRYNLASSGMPPVDPMKLGLLQEAPEFLGSPEENNVDRYPRLHRAIAEWTGAGPAQVLTGIGTSGINLLALRAMAEPGDTVLVESPVYEPLKKLPLLLGFKTRAFRRNPFAQPSIDFDGLEKMIIEGAKAIVLSNLYNPGGNRLSETELQKLKQLSHRNNIKVLLDEVYMPFCDRGRGHRALSFLESPQFVTTLSLTKAWGLNSLRAGILLCQDECFVTRVDRINDLVNVVQPFVSEHAARQIIAEPEKLDRLLLPILPRIETNWQILKNCVTRNNLGRLSLREAGLCCLFEVKNLPNLGAFCLHLEQQHSLSVVDAAYFDAPGCLRIGLRSSPEDFEAALDILVKELQIFRFG